MSHVAKEPGKSPWFVATVILLVLVIYPLSIGPLGWLVVHVTYTFGGTGGSMANAFYYAYVTPMRWLHTVGFLPEWYWDYLLSFIPPTVPTARP
jgi:hypothetical protein